MTKSHPISLLIFAVLITSMLPGCESANTPQAIEPVNEETTLVSADAKETEVTPPTPPLITPDTDDRLSKSTVPPAHVSPANTSIKNEQAPVDKAAANQSDDQASMSPGGKRTKSARVVIPKKLRGIWSDNDADGKSQCDRYKRAIRHGRNDEDDEVSDSLVGSLVITRHMIHVYSDYGEGNFYAVERISRMQGDKWKLTPKIGIDTFPSDEDAEDIVAFDPYLSSGLLHWKDDEGSSGYFRCSDLTRIDENFYSM